MADEPKFPLNEPQTRRLAILLSRLERALLDLRAVLLLPPQDSGLLKHEDPIDPALVSAFNGAIADAGKKIRQLARALRMPTQTLPVRRTYLAQLELLNLDLHESLPSRGLSNYGVVPPKTALFLEKEIPELESQLDYIIRLLSHGRAEELENNG
jgi:hypothetical protein